MAIRLKGYIICQSAASHPPLSHCLCNPTCLFSAVLSPVIACDIRSVVTVSYVLQRNPSLAVTWSSLPLSPSSDEWTASSPVCSHCRACLQTC